MFSACQLDSWLTQSHGSQCHVPAFLVQLHVMVCTFASSIITENLVLCDKIVNNLRTVLRIINLPLKH